MGKGKSGLELTLDLQEKEQERLEDLAEHDDKKVRRIVERAVKTYLALRRSIPDRLWEEILGVAKEKDVDPGTILGAYTLEIVGQLLRWPPWVLGLSPFHHVAAVPLQPVDTGDSAVLLAVAIALVAVALFRFSRRDLTLG